MGLGHVHHAGESEIIGRHLAGVHGGAETFLVVPAIDPAIGQPKFVGRRVVMEHAFGRVKDLVFLDPLAREHVEHVVEIAVRGFVAADVLGGLDPSNCTTSRALDPWKLRLSVLVRTTSF